MDHWRVSKSSKPTWCPLRCTGDHGRHPLPSFTTVYSYCSTFPFPDIDNFPLTKGCLFLWDCFPLCLCLWAVIILSEQLTPCAEMVKTGHCDYPTLFPVFSPSRSRSLILILASCFKPVSLFRLSFSEEMVRIRESYFMEWMASPLSPMCRAPPVSRGTLSPFFLQSFMSSVCVKPLPRCGEPSPRDRLTVFDQFLVRSCCFLLREARENQSILGYAKRQSSSKNIARWCEEGPPTESRFWE